MLEIGVCDDDHLLLWEMEKYLLELGYETGVNLEVDTYADGDEIVRAVMKGKRFDIIYMDIEMVRLSGMAAAKKIREVDRTVQMVFVTSYESYMKEAFLAAPIGFLVKPIRKTEFTDTFNHILNMIGTEDQYYRFRYDRSDYKVLLKEVIYFESKGRMTEIVCESGRYRLYKNLEAIEDELRGQKMRFVRIHKSYLVSYWRISRFSADIVELMDGICLPVSRSRKKEVEVNLYEAMEWCHV
jgi:DNA-binding LytR/AlgR family response regulator